MRTIRGLRRWFRLPSSESTVARDVDEEIAFHLESRSAELEAAGLSPAAARARAELEFGDVTAARTELASMDRAAVRRSRRWGWVEATAYELRLAARGLARSPGFTAAVVVMLALGIGVNASMFGLADRLLLSAPPHVAEPQGLVRVLYESTPPWEREVRTEATMPYADYVALRDRVAAFRAVAAYSHGSFSVLGRGADALELRVVGVTPEYFSTLGVRPVLGRFFAPEEVAEPRGEPVLVLGHTLWRTRFGSDPAVVGREVELDNRIFTVVGVAPRGFQGIDLEPVEAWVPVSSTLTASQVEGWHHVRWMNWVRIVARLAPDATPEAAASEATATYLAAEEYRERYSEDPSARIVLGSVLPARAPAVGRGLPQRSGRIATWLLGVSAIVLLIACINVANLLLARGIRRRREMGVRIAMGVDRLRLGGHVLAETLLIALLAGGLGVQLAHWGGQLARTLLIPDVDWAGSPVDGRVLGVAAAAAALSMLLAGLLPALHAARSDARELLSSGGRGGTYRRSRLRSGLVVLQATLSVILLVGAGLFVRSLHNARTLPLGYEPDRVAYLQWHAAGLGWSDSRLHQLYDASLERLAAVPEVEAAALSMTGPMWGGMGAGIRVPGRDSVPPPPGMAGFSFDAVSPGYFRALGTRVLRGRAFSEADGAGAAPVAVVTESMAGWLWPGEEALGRCLVHVASEDPPCRQVVGVVQSIRHRNVEEEPTPMFFIPLAQSPPYRGMRVLTVRTRGEPEAALVAIRHALHGLESGLPPIQARLLRHRIEPQLQPWKLGASLFSAFGLLALALAALGLYGVVTYDVAQRRRELGVRRALGARAGNIMRIVLGAACRVVGAGVVIGVGVAAWAAPHVEPLLFDVAPRDAGVLGGVAILLLMVGGAAAFLPGLRAVRVEPAEALRE